MKHKMISQTASNSSQLIGLFMRWWSLMKLWVGLNQCKTHKRGPRACPALAPKLQMTHFSLATLSAKGIGPRAKGVGSYWTWGWGGGVIARRSRWTGVVRRGVSHSQHFLSISLTNQSKTSDRPWILRKMGAPQHAYIAQIGSRARHQEHFETFET